MKKNRKRKKWMSFILSLMLTIAGAFGLAGMAAGQARAVGIAGAASLAKNECIHAACLTDNNMLHGDKLYSSKYAKKINVDFVASLNKIETAKNRSPHNIYHKGPVTYVNDA